jgi:hypothetical protein
MAKISQSESAATTSLNSTGAIQCSSPSESFMQKGYAVARSFVAKPALSFLYEYALKSSEHGNMDKGDALIPGTPCCYADPFMESLLEMLTPKVESVTGVRLFPTYSYFRVYKNGDLLKRHHDRPACEVSVTLNLGFHAEKPWPIWLEVEGEARPTILEPGDALLYKGIELIHWRDPLQGEHSAQVFLHYVHQNGKYAEWKYDQRAGLATTSLVKRVLEQFEPL